ncbi:hypothetical protein NEMBOFW57_004678 [Staphylotrichum longicolle]|uniref:Zn(2)-C6 fungal-type domain-containing protein n=1 Tax=Staphylotrichum longicolle TaxID=669026 RepID=A0AAD4I3V8_9PEZI|nr:hypothetical protein NEMBOFW57_004678 [Staphylotrichum longicolle]
MADANQAPRPPAPGTPSTALKLACYACKRKMRPICSLCLKLNVACEYPSHPEKPGPKTGESIS